MYLENQIFKTVKSIKKWLLNIVRDRSGKLKLSTFEMEHII